MRRQLLHLSKLITLLFYVVDTTPHAPTNVTARFGHFDIKISWKPGFDGGFTQNFIIL